MLRRLWTGLVVAGLAGAPSAAAQTPRPVVAVFGLQDKGAGLKPAVVDGMSEYVATQLVGSGRYLAVPNSDLKTALARQKAESYKTCYDETCQIEVGKELAANKALSGTIFKIGKRCIVTLTLLDLRRSAKEAAGSGRGPCTEDGVLESVDKALAQLVGRGGRISVSAAAVTGPDYGDPDAEIQAAEAKSARRSAAQRARRQAAERDWKKIQRWVRDERLPVKRRVRILKKHLAAFDRDNPHAPQAEALIAKLEGIKNMVRVPAGEFYMGCNARVDDQCDDDEMPGRRVSVKGFRIDQTEVTVAAYRKCVDAGQCSSKGLTTGFWDGEERAGDTPYCNWNKWGRDQRPINCVSWSQARRYCAWANKRLPTEREWEKAARGADGRKYPWGNQGYSSVRFANIADESAKARFSSWTIAEGYNDGEVETAPVGSFSPAGDSPFGVKDMIGNVREWVADAYENGRSRGVRGGSWATKPTYARASDRSLAAAENRYDNLGFRCAQPE